MKRIQDGIMTIALVGLVALPGPALGADAAPAPPTARAMIAEHFAAPTQADAAPPTAAAQGPSEADNALLALMLALVKTHNIGVVAGVIPEPFFSYAGEAVQIVSDTALKFLPPRLLIPENRSVDSNGADGPGYTVDGCGVEFELLSPRANYTNMFGVANFRDPYTQLSPFKVYPWRRVGNPDAADTRWGYLRAPRLYHANTSVTLWLESLSPVRRFDLPSGTLGLPYLPIDSLAEQPQQVYLPIGEHAIAWNASVDLNLLTDVGLPATLLVVNMVSEAMKAYGGLQVAKQVKKAGIGDEAAEAALDPAGAKRLSDGVKRFNDLWAEQFKARKARRAKALRQKFIRELKANVLEQVVESSCEILFQLNRTGMNSIDGTTRDKLPQYIRQLSGYQAQRLTQVAPALIDATWVVFRDRFPGDAVDGIATETVCFVLKKVASGNDTEKTEAVELAGLILNELLGALDQDFARFVLDLVELESAYVQKNQFITVLDSVPPTIAFGSAPLELEATDFGGTRLARARPTLLDAARAASSDNCGREPDLDLSGPALLPVGETTEITWRARDKGPNPQNDGQNYSPEAVQRVLVLDRQPPLMLAPPSKVFVTTGDLPYDPQAMGEAVAIDLVDVQPTVSSDAPASLPLNARTPITWTAVDDSGNPAAPQVQLISVKSTNTAPIAFPTTAATETAQPVPITLSGADADVLDGIPDPLWFKIESQPANGEFIAPLYPFFVEDYRTAPGDATFDPPLPADADLSVFISSNYCSTDPKREPPRDFVHQAKFVHVTDDGTRYLLDEYFECPFDINGAAAFPRFSKWDADGNFLGQVRIGSTEDDEPVRDTFRVDRDGYLYFNTVLSQSRPDAELGLQRCSLDWPTDGNVTTTDVCNKSYIFVASTDSPFDGATLRADTGYARIDSKLNVAYVADGSHLMAYELAGNLVRYLGELGPRDANGAVLQDWFGKLPSLEVGTDGAIYANDVDRHRVHKVAPTTLNDNGEFVLGDYVGWSGQCVDSTNNACDTVNERSRGYLCTDTTCTVCVAYDQNGVCTATGPGDRPGPGARQGQFNDPRYISLDPRDVLYIADYDNFRIQRLSPDGSFAGEAVSEGTGINTGERPGFVLGNFGRPESVAVNSSQFFIVDRDEQFVNVLGTLPFKDITDNSVVVEYVSNQVFPGPLNVADDVFSFSVSDGLDRSAPAEVRVTVSRTFRAPEALADTLPVPEDGSVAFELPARDPDGIIGKDVLALDQLTYSLTRWPEHGTLSGFGKDWTYAPEPDYFGPDAISFKVNDGRDDSAEATLTFDVTPDNDAPEVAVDPPARIGLGFPVLVKTRFMDDAPGAVAEDYRAGIDWGDGSADITGEVSSDEDGSDARIEGVVIVPPPTLDAEGSALAMHTWETPGEQEIYACLQDVEGAEGCATLLVNVESLASLAIGGSFYATPLAEDEITLQEYPDGRPLVFETTLVNGQPSVGPGEVAANVAVQFQLPDNMLIGPAVAEKGSCAREGLVLSCAIGDLSPGEAVRLLMPVGGPGNLIYNEARDFAATMTTTSEAVASQVNLSIAIEFIADISDTDADGMSDTFEATYNFDPAVADGDQDADADGLSNAEEYGLGTSPRAADTDGDGLTDQEEDARGSDPLVDDNPPVLIVPPDLTVNATGALTAVDIGTATAEDFKDGTLDVFATNRGPFQPGPNTVIWRAFDAAGNRAEGYQFVNVVPLVNFAVDQVVAEGATAQATVALNGSAVTYPVVVPFTVAGTAGTPQDHDAVAGEIVIESGLSASLPVAIAADVFDEPDETLRLIMGTPENAVAGVRTAHVITISEQNQPPRVEIGVEQQGRPSTTIASGAGLLAVVAELRDDPAQDHSFDWSGSDAGAFDPATANDPSYLLDPVALTAGLYGLRVDVMDDGIPPLGVNTRSLLRVEDEQLILRFDEDVDGDGVNDAEEGPDDSDGDRIPDYLDNLGSINQLRIGDDGRILEAETGRRLRLGATAFAEASTFAGLEESSFGTDAAYGFPSSVVDFEVLRVEQGGSARVVVPLAVPTAPGSVYKTFVNGDWQTFIVGGGDELESAPGTDGACPPAGAAAYRPGLAAGALCVQLVLTDGGPNDLDGTVDAVIRSTGGLATPVSAELAQLSRRRVRLVGDGEAVVARYRLHSASGDVELRSVTIEARGTGDETQIDAVSLIVDRNRDGVFDDGDTELADGLLGADNGTLTLTLAEPLRVAGGDTDLMVVYRFGPPID